MRNVLTRLFIYGTVIAVAVFIVFLHRGAEAPSLTLEWLKTGAGIAAASAAGLALAALIANIDRAAQYLTPRRLATAINVFLMCALAGGIVGAANYIGWKRYRQWDWTLKNYYTLSDRTKKVLQSLEKPVTAHVFLAPGSEFFTQVRGLLDAYRAVRPDRFEVEIYNPGRDRKKLEDTVARLGIDPKKLTGSEVVIFEAPGAAADAVPRTKYISIDDIVERDYSLGPHRPRLRAFKGEEQFTKALIDVSRERPAKVYLLSGHSELDTFGEESVRRFDAALRNLNYDVEALKLDFGPESKAKEVPADCDVLAILGPKTRFDDQEIAALKAYLERGGRLLLMAEPILKLRPGTTSRYFEDTRLDLLLKDYGVAIDLALVFDVVFDPGLGAAGYAEDFAAKFEGPSREHPISKPLVGLGIAFSRASPLRDLTAGAAGGEEGRPRVQVLIETSPQAVSVKDVDALRRRPPDAVADRKGPLPLAVAVTCKVAGGKEARLVVTGDASIATDALTELIKGELDFVLNATSWLAEREETIAIDAKPPEILRLHLEPEQAAWLRFMSLVEIPLACAAVALFVWAARRR